MKSTSWKSWIAAGLLLLLTHSLCRMLFFQIMRQRFADVRRDEIMAALLYGLRFDASFLASYLGIAAVWLIFGWTLPSAWQTRWWRAVLLALTAVSALGLLINIGDAAYYPYSGRHASFSQLLTSLHDWRPLIAMATGYPSLWLFLLVGTAVAYTACRAFVSGFASFKATWPGRLLLVLPLLALFAVTIRGGWQHKPLSTSHAYTFSSPVLGDLALSSAFSVTRTIGDNALVTAHYFDNWDDVVRLVNRRALDTTPAPLPSTKERLNFFIIIWESLGAEYTAVMSAQPSYTPFLDSLLSKSLWFPHSFANGRRSIESSTSIIFGIPSLTEDPLIQSPFAGGLVGLPALLKAKGYRSLFMHGGARGSMFFDVMASIARFDRHLSREDFPDPSADDGNWGIFDGPFFSWCVDNLHQMEGPFFATLFTLSSHSPYVLPKEWRGRLPAGTLPIHASIAYTDHMLKSFFERAASMPWFRNTIFIITGDHTSLSSFKSYSDLSPYRVPIIFFSPGGQIPPQRSERIVQHADIIDTVLQLAGVTNSKTPLFGQSVLTSPSGGRALNFLGGTYWLLEDDAFIRLSADKEAEYFKFASDLHASVPLTDKSRQDHLLNTLRASVQYFSEGLTLGKLYGSATEAKGR